MTTSLNYLHASKWIAGLALLIGLLGFQSVKSHYSAIKKGIQERVRGVTPWEYEVNRLEELIREKTKDIMEFEGKIAEVEANARSHQADVDQMEACLETDRKDLAKERDLLGSDRQEFTIRGVPYTRQQIVASAEARMVEMERNQSTIETKRQVIDSLGKEISHGYTELKQAFAHRDATLRELETLSAQMVNIQLRQEMQEMTGMLKAGSVSGLDGELPKSMLQFRQRVQMEERKLNAASQVRSAPKIITHESPSRPGLLEEMNRVLRKSTAPIQPESQSLVDLPTNSH